MADGITIQVRGLKEVNRSLFAFSKQLGDTVVLKALREGAKVIQKQARASSPRKTGRLRRGIVIKNSRIYSKRRGGNTLGVYIDLRRGKGRKDKKDAFYGRFQEKGWNVRGKRRGRAIGRSAIRERFGARTGRTSLPGRRNIPGKNFIDNAFRAKQFESVRVAIRATELGAEVVARKVGVRYAR